MGLDLNLNLNLDLDPRIWSRLPGHLLERVLSFLPLKTFLPLRTTCKNFNSLLFSPNFASNHSLSPSSLSSLILLSHPQLYQKCPLFNTLLNSWCNISLYPPFPNLLSSSNGLLCFSIPNSSSFIICNPLTRSLRRVNFPSRPFNFELFTLVSTPKGGYKLFMLSSIRSLPLGALVYDSISYSWQHFPSPDPILIENHNQKGTLHNGALFFTTNSEPFQLVSCCLATGKWEKPLTELPNSLTFAKLASDGARKLYLIGGIGACGISRSVKVWEMREDGKKWLEVETMPESVCRKFVAVCYHNYGHVYCFWHQGLVCVGCYTWHQVLYFKVERRTWHWMPKCPSLPDKWSCGFRWFSFKPDLYATV